MELTQEEYKILTAKPTEERDKSSITWRKHKRVIRGKRTVLQRTSPKRPTTHNARFLLEQANRNLDVCQDCGSTIRINIHHINENPYDDSLGNLAILCWRCHTDRHFADEKGVR